MTVVSIRKEVGPKVLTNRVNATNLWNFISLEGNCFVISAVASADPLEAIALYGEASLLGADGWLPEGEPDEPLKIAWISLEWSPPVLMWHNTTELGLGIDPVEVSDTEVQMALRSEDKDYVLAAIIEQRLAEKYPTHTALPDFGRCRRLIPEYFPEEIQRRHRLAKAAWEIQNKRSADGIFM